MIVDEIAAEDARKPYLGKRRLRLCTLISTSFRARSRMHLFANMEIVIDKVIQTRSKRLLQIYKSDRSLLSTLRSLKLRIDNSAKNAYSPPKLVAVNDLSTRLVQSIRLGNAITGNDNFTALLQLLSNAQNLTSLSLEGIPKPVDWIKFISTNHRWSPDISSLSLKDTVRHLQIIRIDKFDLSFVIAPNSSRRLHSFSFREGCLQTPRRNPQNSFLNVENLELFTIQPRNLLLAAMPDLLRTTPDPSSSRLESRHKLVSLSLNSSADLSPAELQTILQHSASSLRTLVLTIHGGVTSVQDAHCTLTIFISSCSKFFYLESSTPIVSPS